MDIVADLAISQADTTDGDMSFEASSDRADGGIGGEGAILADVASGCALGVMSGSDAASSAGSGCCCSGCDPAFCAILGGAGEGDRNELSFERSLLIPFLKDSRMMRVEDETSWMVEELGKELKQNYHDVPHEVACEFRARLDDMNTWGVGRTCPLYVILKRCLSWK